MPDITKTKDALWEVGVALKHLEFVIRFEGYCHRVPKSDSLPQFLDELNVPHLCDLPEGLVEYDTPFSENEVIMHAGIAVSTALGVSAQILNKAYEQACVKVIISPVDPSSTVRLYINQVRNLFQHSAGDPIWDIIPKKQVVIELNISGNKLKIDFADLQGKKFEYSQIGGLKWWISVADFAMRDIKSIIGEQKVNSADTKWRTPLI